MSGLVFAPLGPIGDALAVLDTKRRVYVGLSHDASYLHVVHPAAVDLVNADGATVRRAGELVCTCKGSAFRGTCYRVKEAEAFEAGQAAGFGTYVDSPWGAGEALEASRG